MQSTRSKIQTTKQNSPSQDERRGKTIPYLISDPPSHLATRIRLRRAEGAVKCHQDRRRKERNRRKREGIPENLPVRPTRRRNLQEQTRSLFFFWPARVFVSPDWWERQRSRAAPTSRPVKGQRLPGPRVGGLGPV
jgi:hypothetical protein